MSKHFTKVTKQNIHLILFRVNQFLQRNDVVSDYVDWGKYPKQMNKYGFFKFDEQKYVEKSATGYILKSKYQIELSPNYGILIRPSKDCCIAIVYGDRVSISSTRIIVKGEVNPRMYGIRYLAPSNELIKAHNNYNFEEKMSDSYWADVANEY